MMHTGMVQMIGLPFLIVRRWSIAKEMGVVKCSRQIVPSTEIRVADRVVLLLLLAAWYLAAQVIEQIIGSAAAATLLIHGMVHSRK
jgi:hypothetical protein